MNVVLSPNASDAWHDLIGRGIDHSRIFLSDAHCNSLLNPQLRSSLGYSVITDPSIRKTTLRIFCLSGCHLSVPQ
jgi:hypothetical protein